MSKHSEQALPAINGHLGNSGSSIIPKLLWLGLLGWVIRVTIFLRQRSSAEFSSIDIYAIIQIGIILFILSQIIMSGRFRPIWSSISKTSIKAFIFYYVFCAISALWSPSTLFSFYRAFEFMVLLIGVLIALSYCSSFEEAERKILFISIIVTLLAMYVETRLTNFEQTLGAWHNNSFTAMAAMLFIYCLAEYSESENQRKKRLKRYGLFYLFALVLGTSSASFIAAICGFLFLMFIKKNFKLFFGGSFILALMVLVGIDVTVVNKLIFYGKSEVHIATLDGRTHMWENYFHYVMMRPIFGSGFAVIKDHAGAIISSDPHNSFFSIVLGTGAVGFTIVLVYGIRLTKEFFRSIHLNVPGAYGCGCALLTGLINSLSMSFIFDEWEESTLVFANVSALFILFVYQYYQQRVRHS